METIELLKTTQLKTLAFFDLPETDLNKSYGPGKWNIRQILNHLADAEIVLNERIRRAIAEEHPFVVVFDQDRWKEALDYDTYPLSLSKQVFASVRSSIIYLAEKHYVGSEHITFFHTAAGIRTLKQEFDKVAQHNFDHIKQIEIALNPASH
ncbi:MAG: DinB family protein [Bacteroidota bacterium]